MGAAIGVGTLYYTIAVFSISYATTRMGFSRGDALAALILGACCQIVTIPFFGWLADKAGARRLYIAGGTLLALAAIPLFMGLNSGSIAAYTASTVVALSLCYAALVGPQSSLFGAQFPPELRYSGLSIGVNFASAIGGGLAAMLHRFELRRFVDLHPNEDAHGHQNGAGQEWQAPSPTHER